MTRSAISIQYINNCLDAFGYTKEKILRWDLDNEDVYFLTELEV